VIERREGAREVCQNTFFKSHRGEWDTMVGEFLEFSVSARPLAASFEFYAALGFTSQPVSDTLPDPYVVVGDGRVALGLHEREQDGAWLTFVRPGVRDYVRALRRVGVELEEARLADDEFHRVVFKDPGGQGITLQEARTFPPSVVNPNLVTACGAFFEYSLPAASLAASRDFWQALGFAPVASGETPHAWARLEGHGLTLGLHEAHFVPGMSFRAPQLQTRLDYLRAKGVSPRAGCPLADPSQPSATLTAPDGLRLYVCESGEQ
jgi:hypothetical protein